VNETPHPAQTAPDVDPTLCRWGYGRPRKPREGTRGPEPQDCGHADPGGPVHNPLNWWRRAKAAQADAGPVKEDRAPVDSARRDARSAIERAEQLGAQLVAQIQLFVQALHTSADPDAVAAQIEGAVADAQEAQEQARAKAARAEAARLRAEAERDAARTAADQMAAQTQDAEDATAAALTQLDEVQAETGRLTEVINERDQQITVLQADLTAARQAQASAEQAERAAAERIAAQARDLAQTQQQLTDRDDQTRELREELARARTEATQARAGERDAHAQVANLTQQLATLAGRLASDEPRPPAASD
jgi:chromosome segregation ATPase